MLVIWLAGHLAAAARLRLRGTPLWAGIYMLPLTAGFLIAGPISGYLSDRFGRAAVRHRRAWCWPRCASCGLMLLPVNFSYWLFALLILGNGIGSGLFAAPNTAAIMSAVPPATAGSASGMRVDLPELRHVAVHRHLLLADDRRAGLDPARAR